MEEEDDEKVEENRTRFKIAEEWRRNKNRRNIKTKAKL